MNKVFKEANLPNSFCQKQLSDVTDLINSSTSFAIVSMPALGVSMFLRFLGTRPVGLMVHIDINELNKPTKLDFFKLLLKELGEEREFTDTEELVDVCRQRLEVLIKDNQRIVLIYNHFDSLEKEYDRNFFANLRSLRDIDKEKIVMIFSSRGSLPEIAPESVSGGNLNMYSKTYYFKYTDSDLEDLTELNTPHLINGNFKKALKLADGHYQLLQLLLKTEYEEKPLEDPSINLQFKDLYQKLNYNQRKQLQKVILGKKLTSTDPYLVNIGYLNGANLFSSLFADYIKSTMRLKLPLKEEELFKLLKSRNGRVIKKDEIFEILWPNGDGSDWALNALVYRLKKNPTFQSSGYTIENQKKVGYCLVKT